MQDFPPNSQKAKATEAPREKLHPVTSATKTERKRGLGTKFKDTFFGGSAREAAKYSVTDVVVPGIRDMLHDAMMSSLDQLFYGDRNSRPRPGRSSSGIINPAGQVNYSRMSTPAPSQASRSISRQSRARHNLDELVIPTRLEAEEVIDRLFDVLSRYGSVSVADLYELTGVQSAHTDMKWGWTNLRGAKPVRLRQGGFLLDLPEPEGL